MCDDRVLDFGFQDCHRSFAKFFRSQVLDRKTFWSGGTLHTGMTPLSLAVCLFCRDWAITLLEATENEAVGIGNSEGWTPMFFAAITGNDKMIELLWAHGGNVNMATSEPHIGGPPVHLEDYELGSNSFCCNDFSMLVLRDQPSSIDGPWGADKERLFVPAGATPLWIAAMLRKQEAANTLILLGAVAEPELVDSGEKRIIENANKAANTYRARMAEQLVDATQGNVSGDVADLIARYVGVIHKPDYLDIMPRLFRILLR
jgi:ankyrin repeat protein